jgi:hypothetical protein
MYRHDFEAKVLSRENPDTLNRMNNLAGVRRIKDTNKLPL